MDVIVVEDHTPQRSVMINQWRGPKKKKQTLSTEDIEEVIEEEDTEETTTAEILKIGEIVNQETTTETLHLEMITLPFHQPPKRYSKSPILRKLCENSWSLKNRQITLSKINSIILKPKSN